MKRIQSVALLYALAIMPLAGGAETSEKSWWPQFRGPNGSGRGSAKPPVEFGPDQNLHWKTTVGAGISSPIIWAERIFLTEFDARTRKLTTVCLDRRDGGVLWRRD